MKQLFFAGFSLVMLFSPGCKKTGNDQAGSGIKSHISLIDKNNQVVSNVSGVLVSVENSDPLQTVPVSSKGEFELPALTSSGTIVLVFSHPGYGTVKQYYTQSDLEGVSVQGVFLLPKSSVVVNSLSGTLTGDVFRMTFNVSVPESTAGNGVTFFIEKNNAEVSFADCPGNNSVSRFLTVPVTDGNNITSFCLKCAKECGFLQSGDTAYLKAYGDIKAPYGSNYVDLSTNKLVFPSINPNSNSSTIWFVVP